MFSFCFPTKFGISQPPYWPGVGLDWIHQGGGYGSGLGWSVSILDLVGLDWIGLAWIGLDWIELDWSGAERVGADWIGLG